MLRAPTRKRSLLLGLVTPLHVALYRITRGRIGGRIAKCPVLLLTTTGRKSKRPRTVPLLYMKDAGTFIVVASYGGFPQHPSWYRNLVEHPACSVQITNQRRSMVAVTVDGATRQALWQHVVATYAGYARYQAKTQRVIPLVRLTPLATLAGITPT